MARRKRRTMFGPARHRKLARIVTIKSVTEAKRAAQKLLEMFRAAKSRKQKVTIKRATVLAANRALVMARRRDLHPETKRRLRKVAMVYYAAAEKMVLG